MSTRHPYCVAGAITAGALSAGLLLGAGTLAVLGSTVSGSDLTTAAGWVGQQDATAASARAAEDRRAMTPDDATAVQLLAKAARSADTVAYTGTLVTTTQPGQPPTRAQVSGLPGVGTVVQGGGDAAVLAGEGRSQSLADASRVLDLLVDNYRVTRESGRDQIIAGRMAEAVEAYRPAGTLAARFWLDLGSGLLVRRDLVSTTGSTSTSTRFIALRLGPVPAGHLPPLATDAWSHILDDVDLAARRAAGCVCADTLPGGLTLLLARTDDDGAEDGPGQGVTHLLYSDGLTEMSLFDQPGQLDPSAAVQLQGKGFLATSYHGMPVLERVTGPSTGVSVAATGEWIWQAGPSVITMMAPAEPRLAAQERAGQVMSAVQAQALAAPRPDGPDGVAASVGRGWSRLVTLGQQSWGGLR